MTEVEFLFNTRLGDPQNWFYFVIAVLFSGFMGVTLWRRKRAIELMIHERNEALLLISGKILLFVLKMRSYRNAYEYESYDNNIDL